MQMPTSTVISFIDYKYNWTEFSLSFSKDQKFLTHSIPLLFIEGFTHSSFALGVVDLILTN